MVRRHGLGDRYRGSSYVISEEEANAFEDAVVSAVTGSIVTGLDEFIRAFLAAVEAAIRSGRTDEVGRLLADRIAGLQWQPMRPRLVVAADNAVRRGVAAEIATIPRGKRRMRAERATYRFAPRPVPDPDAALRKAMREAQTLARQGIQTRTQARKVVGRMKAGRHQIQGHARQVANEGLNAGVLEVARALDENVMWVPERNACLHCLAHAGWVVAPGKPFPAVSFDPEAKAVRAVDCPPLHPNCRCRLQSVDLAPGAPSMDRSDVSPSSALAREARRTVVYQWTDHASGPAAERAAAALLRAGASLPGTVEQRARRALSKGGVRRPK
jgi:hypothetical protein